MLKINIKFLFLLINRVYSDEIYLYGPEEFYSTSELFTSH